SVPCAEKRSWTPRPKQPHAPVLGLAHLGLLEQPRQLRNVARNASRLVHGEHLRDAGRVLRPPDNRRRLSALTCWRLARWRVPSPGCGNLTTCAHETTVRG